MDTDPNFALTLAAVAAVAATALLALALHLRNRPRAPGTGPVTMDLGDEPPAVVDLLTDGFELTPEAVPATLVDLAARRWFTIEEAGGGDVIIRLRSRAPSDVVAPFEERVLAHIRGLAVNGVVPATTMTTGPEAASKRWWRKFRDQVIDDAQRRGLCRDRWTKATLIPIWAGVVLSGVLLWLAVEAGRDPVDPTALTPRDVLWGATVAAAIALGAWSFSVLGRRPQRDTPAGRNAAARWFGVRQYMATVGRFEDKPAAMVTLWDRYLAHAVALDLAPKVVAQLPLGAEDHRHAWSRATGTWRPVRVRYPWLRPGYGLHPLLALLTGVLFGAMALGAAVLASRIRGAEIEPIEDLPSNAQNVADNVALALGTVGVAVLAWNALKVLGALADLFVTREVTGVVVRKRLRRGMLGLRDEPGDQGDDHVRERYFCALDTGERDTIVAWRVSRTIFDTAAQGQRYTARVTPRLGYVRELRRE